MSRIPPASRSEGAVPPEPQASAPFGLPLDTRAMEAQTQATLPAEKGR